MFSIGVIGCNWLKSDIVGNTVKGPMEKQKEEVVPESYRMPLRGDH